MIKKQYLQYKINMWPHVINLLGFLLRLVFIVNMSENDDYYEGNFSMFTDYDYKVYADAALYDNPYDRHTYRYSPVLAMMVGPTFKIHQNFGKILIAFFDVIAGYYLFKLFQNRRNKTAEQNRKMSIFMVFNNAFSPLNVYISIRGNCEGIIMAIIYAFFYYFFSDTVDGDMSALERRDKGLTERQPDRVKRYISYAIFGFAVHFRVFPIIFVPLMIMYEYYSAKESKIWHTIKFTTEFGLISGGVFLALAGYFYNLYGYDFLHETYFYHLTRRDNRHSHSAFFYEIYLNFQSDSLVGSPVRSLLRSLPFLIIIGFCCFKFVKYHSFYRVFNMLLFMFVIFNKVINMQYFIWTDTFYIISFFDFDFKSSLSYSLVTYFPRIIFILHKFLIPTLILWDIQIHKLRDLQEGYTLQTLWSTCLLTHFLYIISFYMQMSKIEPYTGLESLKKKELEAAKKLTNIKND